MVAIIWLEKWEYDANICLYGICPQVALMWKGWGCYQPEETCYIMNHSSNSYWALNWALSSFSRIRICLAHWLDKTWEAKSVPYVAPLTSMRLQWGTITYIKIILVLHTEGCMYVDIALKFKKITFIYRKWGCILRIFPLGKENFFTQCLSFLETRSLI